MKKVFSKTLFPRVAELFRILKTEYPNVNMEKQHSRLPILLQAIESHIILNKCCKRIWEEREHQVPIFTIHDSIVTTVENVEYVREVMMQELNACIGVPTAPAIEEWHTANLDKNILAEAQA